MAEDRPVGIDEEPVGINEVPGRAVEIPDGTDVTPVPKLDLTEDAALPDVSCDKILLSAGANVGDVVTPAGADVVVPMVDVCELGVPIVTPASIEDIADETLGIIP